MTTRRLVLLARALAGAGIFTLRGRARIAAHASHDFLWLYPTLTRNCTWHGPVVTRFATNEKQVWLTLDDGPDPRDTPGILDALGEHGALASFFAIGKKVEAHRSICRRIISEGHTLENHTYSHPSALFWGLPCCAMRPEIERCTHAILSATGRRPNYFRPPVGMANACVHPLASKSWLRVTGWSADGLDGLRNADPEHVVHRIMKNVRPGSVLLVHEGGVSESRVHTVRLLLSRLATEGYQCVLPVNASLC